MIYLFKFIYLFIYLFWPRPADSTWIVPSHLTGMVVSRLPSLIDGQGPSGIHCSRSAKTPNPDDPTPIFVRGRESTCVTFVLENPHYRTAFIFAMEQSWSGSPPLTGATFAWGPFRPLAFSGPHTPPECEASPEPRSQLVWLFRLLMGRRYSS